MATDMGHAWQRPALLRAAVATSLCEQHVVTSNGHAANDINAVRYTPERVNSNAGVLGFFFFLIMTPVHKLPITLFTALCRVRRARIFTPY